ncbi:hypothetical protein NGRA_2913 [Nosema granulosis]|uniref:BED-type domain-containing protein n=1 Tax=Nosema granulosis TaxID=83296 RepID=A0A9P6GYZ0_9MICR|nr:hypothetical protein NGRA_2913 [Nosema granulosis]
MSKKSIVWWRYFLQIEKGLVKCNIFQQELIYRGKSTTVLHGHLKAKHPFYIDENKKTENNLSYMISDRNFDMDIAKLADADGITFNSNAKSKFIRRSLSFEYPNVKRFLTQTL